MEDNAELLSAVNAMVKKATDADTASDALQFAQAAAHLANAYEGIQMTKMHTSRV